MTHYSSPDRSSCGPEVLFNSERRKIDFCRLIPAVSLSAPLTFLWHRGIIRASEMNMKAAHRCRLRAVKREPGENPGRYSHCDGERFPRATGKLGRRKRAEPSQETCLGVESPICCLQIDLPACVFFGMRVPGKIFVARKSGCRRCSRFYISSDGVPGAFPEHKILERR